MTIDWSQHRNAGRFILRHGLKVGALILVVVLIHRTVFFINNQEHQLQDRLAIDPGTNIAVADETRADESGADSSPGSMEGELLVKAGSRTVEEVAKLFDEIPYVRKVLSAERVADGRVKVRYTLRPPELAVQVGDQYVLLGSDLVRLPGTPAMVPGRIRRPVVTGLQGPPPEAGKKWDRKDLSAAWDLAQLSLTDPTLHSLDVQEVDISKPSKGVWLKTLNQCEIFWGLPERIADSGELTREKKIENLRRVLRYYPHLDGVQIVRVHVTPPTVKKAPDKSSARRP